MAEVAAPKKAEITAVEPTKPGKKPAKVAKNELNKG